MSSARKRSAITKANQEADFQRQRAILAEHHASVMESFARLVAARGDELRAQACRARNLIECGETAAALNCLCDAIEQGGIVGTMPMGSNA